LMAWTPPGSAADYWSHQPGYISVESGGLTPVHRQRVESASESRSFVTQPTESAASSSALWARAVPLSLQLLLRSPRVESRTGWHREDDEFVDSGELAVAHEGRGGLPERHGTVRRRQTSTSSPGRPERAARSRRINTRPPGLERRHATTSVEKLWMIRGFPV
jgi:hypothetical protein